MIRRPDLSPKADILLVLGGARSGKSAYAEKRARGSGREKHYLATSQILDAEMAERIGHHRERREGEGWHTVEEPLHLSGALEAIVRPGRVVLVDCLTLWLTNLMVADRDVIEECRALIDGLPTLNGGEIIFVSNEVGLGIVPDNAMARAFRDHAGRLHQSIAELADEVIFVAAGLPLTMKARAGEPGA